MQKRRVAAHRIVSVQAKASVRQFGLSQLPWSLLGHLATRSTAALFRTSLVTGTDLCTSVPSPERERPAPSRRIHASLAYHVSLVFFLCQSTSTS